MRREREIEGRGRDVISAGRNCKRSNSRVVGDHVLSKCVENHSAVRKDEPYMQTNEKKTESLGSTESLVPTGFYYIADLANSSLPLRVVCETLHKNKGMSFWSPVKVPH